MAQLTKEQMAAIDSYSDDIETLKDQVTAMRKMPGYYIAGVGYKGALSLIREGYQNSIDQIMDPTSPADTISVYYNEQTLECEIADNGKGFPYDSMVRMITVNHTSKNYQKKKGEYSCGLHGTGLKCIAFLSSECHVSSYRYDGTAMQLDLNEGYIVGKGPYKIPNKEKKQGSIVRFIPSTEVLGEINLSWNTVYHLLKDILSLSVVGSKVKFEGVDKFGEHHVEYITNNDGIITKLIENVSKPLCKPIIIGFDNGEYKLDAAFCYDMGENDNVVNHEFVTAFCNMCPTIEGEHINGTIDGICKWFSQYMNSIYLANQKSKIKIKVNPSDIKTGLNCMISGFCLEPVFVGQAKEQLNVPKMEEFCKMTIMKGLDEWSKSNPQDLARLAKFFKDVAELRMKDEAGRSKIVQKFKKNANNNLPEKYVRPLGNKDIELVLVEGDSAKGTVELGRNPETQGIFGLRGKIINAFAHSREEVFSNQEVQAITQIILGGEYRRNFTIDEVKVSKIIIMTDADPDGNHIAALILRLFIMYFPQIIEAGMLYKAIPPLYAIPQGKNWKYFTEQIDMTRYVQKSFLSQYAMTTVNDKQINNRDITKFLLNNEDYVWYLEKAANTYSVDPYLLEMTLYNYISNNRSINVKKLSKDIKKVYRFMDVIMVGNTPTIIGDIDASNFIPANDKFFVDCEDSINMITNNEELYYKLNGKVHSLYQILKLYKLMEPSEVKRFKGLGEMNKEMLAESALYPGSDRTLIRYTMEDAKETMLTIREYESDTKKILGEIKRVSRTDLLD